MMRCRKFAILIFTMVLSAVAFWSYNNNEWAQVMPLTATVTSEGYEEAVTCWKDQWNDYYFFFPSYCIIHKKKGL